jgi:hypothetical protein
MKLVQKDNFKNFYLPTDNSKFIIFSADTANVEFNFEKAFTAYTFHFLLIFYKNDVPQINNALRDVLLGKVGSGRKLYWIDELGISDIDSCPSITITSINQATQYTNIAFGKDEFRIYLKNSNPAGQIFNSTIIFDNAKSALSFTVNNSKKHRMIANKDNENEFDSFIIPLAHQQNLFGFDSKASNNNIGSICFLSLRSSKNSIQPITSLLSPNSQSENILFNYKYFIDESYSQNVDLISIIYPTLDFNNSDSNYQSFIELFAQQDFLTCFIDELGNNFKIPRGSSFINRIAFVNPDSANPISRNFFFMPKGGQSLDLISSGNQLLLGNSGTERQDKTKLEFHEYEEILITENINGEIKSSKYSDSITAITISPKFLTDHKGLNYYIDSEKTPLYDNEQTLHTLTGNISREVQYNPIKVGTISKDTLIPIIPTLSFRDNPNLEELEKVLVKKRLSNGNLIDRSNSITPQGFLKEGIGLEFIKKQVNKKNENNLLKNEKSNFGFSITNIDYDFQTSISKEDVFFVTTPKLLKGAAFKDNFDIFFSIHSFDIDLILKNITAPTDSERIIIFKYSRYTVEELLADTSKWSNYGKFRKTDLSIINHNIKNEFDVFEKKYNGGVNKDYEYIIQSVLRDRNWNGVFILNIPISDSKDLPDIFAGLISAQSLEANSNPNNPNNDDKRQFKTGLKFQYVAFPVNKTEINSSGLIDIKSTSYYGLIDYDLLGNKTDKQTLVDFFPENITRQNNYKFLLSKLLVRFENSEIRNFNSFAFLQVPSLFDDNADFSGTSITHDNTDPHKVKNLIRLEGNYQKNGASKDEFNFKAKSEVIFTFPQEGTVSKILKDIKIKSLSFQYVGGKSYLFNIDVDATFNKFGVYDIFNVGKINFKNIGLSFDINDLKISFPTFDLSSLGVFPDINFDGKGFLSSFPIKFSSFQNFQFPKIKLPDGTFQLELPDMDFFKIKIEKPQVDATWLEDVKNKFANLFSFVFDIDLGTLGDIEALKALKGQLLIGWSLKGGFAIGFKLNGPSTDGLHLDLFGAMKLDIERVDLCSFDNTSGEKTYFLRLIDARLTIFGKELPSKDDFDFNGIIYARPGDKIAWFITATKKGETQPLNSLVLGAGQRVGPNFSSDDTTVTKVITKTKDVFNKNLDPCNTNSSPVSNFYKPDRNWLVASEDFIPKAWRDIFNLKFVFNDPALYGIYIQIVSYIEVDIIYKKLSENLGVYSAELQLDPSLRNQDFGGILITFPNLGIDVYTNGDFKVDIGYPTTSSDWSRSCLIQIRSFPPLVGWAGFYFAKLRTASISLFGDYIAKYPELNNCNIIQAGFAFRVGVGAYIDKGVFYVGASISIYGILEGAFAFDQRQGGLAKFLPDHFALRGRVGAIAELVGYVDFKIIKASIHIILRVEFGMLLVVIKGHGLQPVPLYIEGEVSVSVRVTIGCFKIFRKKICIVIRLSFRTFVRFPYTLGGDSQGLKLLSDVKKNLLTANPIKVQLGEIPLVYIPSLTKSNESGNYLVHHFAINFFGIKYDGDKLRFSENNIFKDNIAKPIFSAILGTNSMSYSDLRLHFLGGKDGSNENILDFSSFKPTLHVGYDDADENFLKDIFRLKKDSNVDEISDFQNTIKNDPCSSNQQCPFRLIPIPISSCIKVNHKNGQQFVTDSNGFKIKLTGIFQDVAGKNIEIEKLINRKNEYSTDDINTIEKHFDGYMTQFLERQNTHTLVVPPKDKDIREDAIIPEYFKLIGLLTLEAYFNFLSSNKANREKPNFDPQIKLDDLFTENTGWKFNEYLENIIGQLNYFYNNGLRLPDVLNGTGLTKAYYDLIKQTNIIQSVSSNPNSAIADIIFSKHDESTSISLKDDMLSGTGLKDFVDKANEILSVNLNDLNNGILKINADAPFQLIDVKLPIPNSMLNSEDKSYRYFEIPNKIHQNFHLEKTNLKLHIINNSNPLDDVLVNYIACSNIEVTIKPHSINGKIKSLELINVYVDDLNLIHKIKANPDFIQTISVYLKTLDVNQNIDYISLIKSGEEVNTRLIKTNLSPRTHPPIIENSFVKLAALQNDNYVANLTEKENFTRLLWEGVTTNNGGFFLMESENSDLFSKIPLSSKDDIKIIFSFESEIAKPFYAFNNFIKMSKDVFSNRKVFEELDKSSHCLYAEVFSISPTTLVESSVKEYHSKIPAHCFGFTIEREELKSGYEHYVPIEFEIKGNSGIDKNNILPLMPLQKKDETTGLTIPNKLFYSHVTPINKIHSLDNLNRYENIGKDIQIEFGVRDTYGFRAITIDKKLDYKHIYFDKLIPINAWPFINISYWFKEYKNNELRFELKIKAFGNSLKITEESLFKLKSKLSQDKLTKLKEIAGKTFLSQAELFQALIGVNLTPSERDNVLKIASEKLYQSFEPKQTRESLNTIIAQLEEKNKNLKVELNKEFNCNDADLKLKLIKSLNWVKTYLENPQEKIEIVEFQIKVNDKLKNQLNPSITISRKVSDDLFANLNDPYIWEYDTIKSISTGINIYNTKPEDSTIKLLNEALKNSNNCPYVLGISSDTEKQKVVYLLNKSYLQFGTVESSPLERSSYFAIKPYSNKLWSGNYLPFMAGATESNFTNEDLDKSLNHILSKIESLLTPTSVKEFTTDYIEKLISCKKLIVEDKFDPENNSELMNKTANIDTKGDTNQKNLRKEFRDLLFESLDNFYKYDGIIQLSPTNPNIDKLKDHRLSISIANQNDYTIQSSKIDFREASPKWFILFDQIGLSKYVEFDILPKLTHIEFDINSENSSPEIEKSTWIQLVEPQDLLPKGKTISTKQSIEDKKWPRIYREFPDKPQIINYVAEQKTNDDENGLSWDNKLGEWQYKISIKDQYKDIDELKIFIKTISLRESRDFALPIRNFKGFIAYWSALLSDKTQKVKLEDFIDDLSNQLSLNALNSENDTTALLNDTNSFFINKDSNGWKVRLNNTQYSIPHPGMSDAEKNINILIGGNGFNLFATGERIKSITSEITAYRNFKAKNDEFVYVTETVSPSSWATPHIKFFTPIKIDGSLIIQDVFNKMKEINLPYKSTAKLLVSTADLEKDRRAKLPVIPVLQMEFKESTLPSIIPFDNIFKNYKNGYPSISLTIYNNSEDENDLPIFFANNIYKQ